MKQLFNLFTSVLFLTSCQSQEQLINYVDPFIGTDMGGNFFPGPCLPFSMVRLSPDIPMPNATSGYSPYYSIDGFSHTHVSGTGGEGNYGNIMVIPETGKLAIFRYTYASPKSNEEAHPGYYAVTLDRWNVRAELASTPRAGMHRYTFPRSKESRILIDPTRVVAGYYPGDGKCINARISIVNDTTIEGSGYFKKGWGPAGHYNVYFSVNFDKPFTKWGVWKNYEASPSVRDTSGNDIGAYAEYETKKGSQIQIKVGISFKSLDNARRNTNQIPNWNFDKVKADAEQIWESYLGRIKVTGGTTDERKLFYTSLYHCFIMPTDLSGGENPLWQSDKPHYWDIYTFWDTFRTLHPLFILIAPDKQREIVNSIIDIYDHTGWLPDAFIAGGHGWVEGTTNCDAVIADAVVKKLGGFDIEKAYAALVKNAEVSTDKPGRYGRSLDEYRRLGYISSNRKKGSSFTLEYAYSDFCVAQVAKALGRNDDYEKYLRRSQSCFNLFNPETHFFWAKDPDGRWVGGFSPTFIMPEPWNGPYFMEGTPWHYSTYVPHDPQGLINRHGGPGQFVDFLNQMFDGNYYSQNNEPDILTPYLYNYAQRPDKTAERVRNILEKEYQPTLTGWPGNDDAGCLSSWYIFSAMGFYPNAGQDVYLIGSPIFSKVEIKLGNGRTFSIIANNVSEANKYVQAATLNGAEWNKNWFRHSEISKGGELILQMGSHPSAWGTTGELPPSVSKPD